MTRYLFASLGLALLLGGGLLALRSSPKSESNSHTLDPATPLEREEIDQLKREVRFLRQQASHQAQMVGRLLPTEEDAADALPDPNEAKSHEESSESNQDDERFGPSPAERRELMFAEEERVAETIMTASFDSMPLSKARTDDLVARFSDKINSIGAELTAVRCTTNLCQADLSYPPTNKPEDMDRTVVQELCRGECWVRRFPDRSKWQIFAASEGGQLPEVGPISTD